MVRPAVVDGREAEEDERCVEDGESDGRDRMPEEREEARNKVGESVAAHESRFVSRIAKTTSWILLTRDEATG